MARKPINSQPRNMLPELLFSRSEASSKITDRIEKGKALIEQQINSIDKLKATQQDYYKWSEYNTCLLKKFFSNDTFAEEYSGAGAYRHFGVVLAGPDPTLAEEIKDLHEGIHYKIHSLESIKERIELINEAQSISSEEVSQSTTLPSSTGRKIFVVHGHDEGARESVARFIERLGLQAIILHEQASEGRTIIEKLEHHSDVDFAVVLLTPDDIGGTASAPSDLKLRARQNVILELGYFIGKLKRGRVCALYKDSVELPSDFSGVVYTRLDEAGAWQLTLAKELRQSGFNVDLNDVI